MKLTDIIRSLGLDERESDIYAACLQKGPLSISDIARETNMKRPTLYPAVQKLADEHFLIEKTNGKRTRYEASSPDVFYKRLEKQTQTLTSAMPVLLDAQRNKRIVPDISVIAQDDELEKLYDEIYGNVADNKEVWFLTSITDVDKTTPWILQNYFRGLEKATKPQVRELLRWDTPGMAYARKLRIDGYTHPCRLLRKGVPLHNDMVLWGDKVAIFSLDEQRWSLVIENAFVSKTFRTLYELAWETGKVR